LFFFFFFGEGKSICDRRWEEKEGKKKPDRMLPGDERREKKRGGKRKGKVD